ncbi:unnamed protein product [Thelazia callipaeda]|uniref:Squamous cell carcinoma antigen recognized by T-cells 3 n=1 Tax=Thelazia callipaeda TaxID=103827 RepID=A0A0N5CK53_THECL|nr:unnamed protein product [Thelazia callipaeda]
MSSDSRSDSSSDSDTRQNAGNELFDKFDGEMIVELEKAASFSTVVEKEPKSYQYRMKLIMALRQNGELKAAREQRECISQIYLMPPSFWMDWIEDEKSDKGDKDVLKLIFERACRDFHSPDIYLEYVQWACGVSLEFAREKMEEAVIKVGVRADYASVIWNVYLDFEKMILTSMNGEKDEKQRQLVESLYYRLLCIPHISIEESWSEYKSFTDGKVSDQCRKAFELSAQYVSDLLQYEKRLYDATDVDEKLISLLDYIAFEKHSNDPARIQMIFERSLCTLASYPNSNIWLQYGNWLDTELKLPQISVDVYARAVRHAPCSALWQQYFSALERSNAPSEEIDSKWPDAQDSITTADEGFSLYRTYIYLLRRRVASKGNSDYTIVLEKFEEGASFLSEKFESHWDNPKAQYRKNYALFLYTVAKQPDKARKIWNDILASGSGHLAAAWIEAANLERFFGTLNNARKLLYRAINSASDHPFTVFEALIQFEREVGTIEELDIALAKVNSQAVRISSRGEKSKFEGGSSRKRRKERTLNFVDKKKKIENASNEEPESAAYDRELKNLSESVAIDHNEIEIGDSGHNKVDNDGFVIPQLPPTMSKIEATSSEDVLPVSINNDSAQQQNTVFISNLDFKLTKERLEEIFPNAKEVRLIYRGMSKLNKGFGYVDFSTEIEAQEALKMDRKHIDGRPLYVSKYKSQKGKPSEFRYNIGLEKNKVFVNNIHYDASEDQLKEIFKVFGTIRDIRIVTHKSGKSKGCAYIEYETDEDAANAVRSGENLFLLERKLAVAISNPPKRKDQQQSSSTSTNLSHKRSKITLIPRALTRTVAAPSGHDDVESNGLKASSNIKMSNEQFRSFLK